MSVFEAQNGILLALFFVMLAVKIYAFINALTFSSEHYEAAGKLTKPAWLLILGLALVLHWVPTSFFVVNIGFTIAALVYLADVRPALAGLNRR